jgi:hypothetical protein
LVLTNSEARKLLSDLSVIGRDLLARSAVKVAEGVRPDEEKLARVDDTAPRDQFITEEGRTTGPHETPILEARIPGTDVSVAQHPKDDLGTSARFKDANGQVKSGQQVYADGSQQVQRLAEQGVNGTQNGVSDTEKKPGLLDRVRGMKVTFLSSLSHTEPLSDTCPAQDNIADRLPQQQKEKVQDKFDRGKHFLTEEYFPEERRDQFIFRAKKVGDALMTSHSHC